MNSTLVYITECGIASDDTYSYKGLARAAGSNEYILEVGGLLDAPLGEEIRDKLLEGCLGFVVDIDWLDSVRTLDVNDNPTLIRWKAKAFQAIDKYIETEGQSL